MKDKVKQLLGLGIDPKTVSSSVGLPEAMITEWLSDDAFSKEVQELRALHLSASAERDSLWDKIETGLLEKLQAQMENGLLMGASAATLARLLQVANAAKRRATPSEVSTQTARPVALIALPISITAKFIVNQKNQVTEIEGRTVATMPASGVMKQLEVMRSNQEANVDEDKKDQEKAAERLEGLVRLSHLPVHELV